jgi:hypothetical protein
MCNAEEFTNAWEAIEALRKSWVFFDGLAKSLMFSDTQKLIQNIADNIKATKENTEVILECSTQGKELQNLACFLRK